MSWRFCEGTIRRLHDAGFSPFLVSAPGEELDRIATEAGVRHAVIPMSREIAPLRDLVSLWKLYRTVRRVRPVLTYVGTPKAGLLAGLAGFFSGIPGRVYVLYGLRLETTSGLKRRLLILTERIACACAHRVLCVSPSLRRRAIELKLAPAEKLAVFGNSGSCCGVDAERFSPAVSTALEKDALREQLGIPSGAPVIGFVGRLTRDKGVAELYAAFSTLRDIRPDLRLLLVGEFEDGDRVPGALRQQLECDGHVVRAGLVPDTAPYYGLMSVLVLPTYREGMGTVSLEAQACGVPVVTTTATGAMDSVVDGRTGFLVPVRSVDRLAARIEELLGDPELRVRMGRMGRERILREFSPDVEFAMVIREYRQLLPELSLDDFPAMDGRSFTS